MDVVCKFTGRLSCVWVFMIVCERGNALVIKTQSVVKISVLRVIWKRGISPTTYVDRGSDSFSSNASMNLAKD